MALYAFDGTTNQDEVDESKDTNVVKFCEAYAGRKFYLAGIGTRKGRLGKALGTATGLGGRDRIDEAMVELERNFAAGDTTIDIVGFSRGAALALHFANVIQEMRRGATIRFLGLWDVVASFGLPSDNRNLGWTLTLPNNVRKCYHALALDERRELFTPTRVRLAEGRISPSGRPQDDQNDDRILEVWFRGVHSDVGGSANLGLSSIAFCWMLRRAKENGLPIDETKLALHAASCDPEATISKNFDPALDPWRKVEAGDWVHESVQSREGYNIVPDEHRRWREPAANTQGGS